MEQLLSMGFPQDLAAEALLATDNDVLRAADWILDRRIPSSTHCDSSNAKGTPPPLEINQQEQRHPQGDHEPSSTPPPNFQHKINRFFQSRCESQSQPEEESPAVTAFPTSSKKRLRLNSETPSQPLYERMRPRTQGTPPPLEINQQKQRHPPEDHKPSSSPPPNFQPKINRFFQSRCESQSQPEEESPVVTPFPTSSKKRPRLNSETPSQPLYERMRPRTLDEVVGQDHILGPNSVLRSAIDCNRLPSILLWGPPGTGKTSIARAIVNSSCSTATSYRFISLSAFSSGVKDVRDAVYEARKLRKTANMRTVLFIDEVHRFNKAQQDSFLPVIEDGSVVFMAATTENPSFHLITPLLSRCRVLVLNPLKPHHIKTLLKRAVSDLDKGLSSILSPIGQGKMMIIMEDEAMEFLSTQCDGDARVALNVLEISATTATARLGGGSDVQGNGGGGANCNLSLTLSDVKEALQCKHLAYDRAGEEHYNLISALHKSMRGSDANASIYWLARMLEGGEEPLYIARRLIRFACEDVGLADPSALPQAVACYQACHFIGMPECNVTLAQCVAYLALAPKSVSVYKAIEAAQKVVRESVGQNEGVPLHLRNAPTKLMKDLGYGKGYLYPPDNPNSSSQTYLPPALQGFKFLDWPNSTRGS